MSDLKIVVYNGGIRIEAVGTRHLDPGEIRMALYLGQPDDADLRRCCGDTNCAPVRLMTGEIDVLCG